MWAVQCATAIHHLITNAVFNLTSDIMIILIPIPLLLRSHWPLRKKMILCAVFGLGIFTASLASRIMHHASPIMAEMAADMAL